MFYIWLAVVLFLSVVEVLTTNLTTVWFVASGIITMLISFVTDSLLIQIGTFVIGGILLLIVTKPLIKKILMPKHVKTNIDRILDMTGVVTKTIVSNQIGEVKVDGKLWSAYAEEEIVVDSIVKILSIDGVKLKVEREVK